MKKNIIINLIAANLSFYSVWSLFIHLLYLLNFIGSTFSVALFVFVFGTLIIFFNYWKYTKFFTNMDLKYHLIGHLNHMLPLFLFYNNYKLNWNILYISLLIYFITLNILQLNPINIYYNIPKHIKNFNIKL